MQVVDVLLPVQQQLFVILVHSALIIVAVNDGNPAFEFALITGRLRLWLKLVAVDHLRKPQTRSINGCKIGLQSPPSPRADLCRCSAPPFFTSDELKPYLAVSVMTF